VAPGTAVERVPDLGTAASTARETARSSKTATPTRVPVRQFSLLAAEIQI